MRNLLGLLLILAAAMSAGWQAHDWHDAKLKLAASEAAEQTRQIVVEVTQQSGEALEPDSNLQQGQFRQCWPERETGCRGQCYRRRERGCHVKRQRRTD